MIRSLFSAFLMYSRIPVPKVEWTDGNRRYALGFFPLVGAVTGGMLIGLRFLFDILGAGSIMFASAAAVLPIIITGGIHLDGFCDVSDALCSFGDKEKRLMIMKDPHIGSFAVIKLVTLMILELGLFSQVSTLKELVPIAAGYVLSRALSGLMAVLLKSASQNGSLVSFTKAADKKITVFMDIFFAFAAVLCMSLVSLPAAMYCTAAAVFTALYFIYSSNKNFGGVTGDLCGWFLQLCELSVLAAAVFSNAVMEALR